MGHFIWHISFVTFTATTPSMCAVERAGNVDRAHDPTGNGNGGLSDKIMIVCYLIIFNYEEFCKN